MNEKQVVVIGGGPAGYTAAVRVSQLGGRVILVERQKLGGICLNWGCDPMLFLTRCVGLLQLMKEVKDDGINVGKVTVDFGRLMAAKDRVLEKVTARMQDTLKANNIEVIMGWANLASPNRVNIHLNSTTRRTIEAKKVILAPGSIPKRLSLTGSDGEGVITLESALDLNSVPRSAVIIGGGVTGLELATFWANLGCVVSVVEIMPQIISNEDHELALFVEQALRADGVQIYTGVEVDRIDDIKGAKSVTISGNRVKHKLEAQLVVFAIGQSPAVDSLGLEDVGVATSAGGIQTNMKMQTSVEGIYAAGDATGEFMLANVAVDQGIVAAENAMGGNSTMDYRVIPRCIRTIPEIAAVGITEKKAKEGELDVRIGKFPLTANTKASILRERSGFVKIIADSTSGEILGIHIIGPQATELIGEAVMIIQMRGTIQDVAHTIHGHPSVHEAIKSAALGLYNQAYYVHI